MAKEIKSNRRNALGRGLGAILSDSSPERFIGRDLPGSGTISDISIDKIEVNPYQPRIDFEENALQELSDSIKMHGLIQPITVRKMGESYQLISGERRLQASKRAGLEQIPAYVRTANDEQMLEMALIENIQREDLNPIEVAAAYGMMMKELNLTLEGVSEKVGKKRATVNNYLRLLKLPEEIQIGLKEGRLSMGHARALITIDDREAQKAIYREILANGLSVRKVEEMVRNLTQAPPERPAPEPKARKSEFLLSLENSLEGKYGNRVILNQNTSGRGEIKITFDSTEDLNRILEIMEV